MKKFVSILLLIALFATLLCSCANAEDRKFKIFSCGSGFYFNRSANKTYKIKELGVTSTENYFYLEDYFVSEELGQPYKIKKGLFNVGEVYLAKKADHYTSKKYTFDLDEYSEKILKITSDMCYVEIYSSNPNIEHELYIQVESRSLPVDITLRNVNLVTNPSVPILFSKAACDINIIAKGTNTISAGASNYTLEEFIQKLQKDALSSLERQFYSAAKVAKSEISFVESVVDGKATLTDVSTHYLGYVSDIELAFMEDAWDAFVGILQGKTGASGAPGASAILVPCGISISGTGSLTVTGGKGGPGGDASVSLSGKANGGTGGDGGDAIVCANYIATSEVTVNLKGGYGGSGGEPSKSGFGLFGSSGSKGASGKTGAEVAALNPRKT